MGPTSSAPARPFRPLLAVALLTLVSLGCGGTGNVSGKVTYQGKVLVFGTVQFEGSDGRIRQANIERDGHYTVREVAPGEAKVAVSSRNPKSSDFIPMQREGAEKRPPPPDIPGWFRIPEKYETTFNSGLTYTIKPGSNQIDIKLE